MPQYYATLTSDLKQNLHTFREGYNACQTIIYEFKNLRVDFYKKLAYVHVPDRVQIQRSGERYLVDSIYIDSIIDIVDHPEYATICLNSVNSDSSALIYIPAEWQTPDICRIAVCKFLYAIACVKTQTAALCELAVRHNGRAICYVSRVFQTQELCEIAVRRHGIALKYVPSDLLTKKLCEIAVRQNGMALEFVPKEFKTYDLCVTAVARTPRAVQFL